MTNQALSILSRDPSLPILGQSALLHFGECVLYSMVLASSYGFFLRKDRLAFVVAVSGIALTSAYPAYLVAGAILYGIVSDVPLILYFYLFIVTAIFVLSLFLYEKTKRFPLRYAEFAPTLTTCLFLVALPSIYLSGMGGATTRPTSRTTPRSCMSCCSSCLAQHSLKRPCESSRCWRLSGVFCTLASSSIVGTTQPGTFLRHLFILRGLSSISAELENELHEVWRQHTWLYGAQVPG